MLGGVRQYAAQHPAQRIARQHVVSDMIGRHYQSCRVPMLPRMRVARLANFPMLPRRRAQVSRRKPEVAEIPAKCRSLGKIKWKLLLPGASEPRLAELHPLRPYAWSFKPLTPP